AYAGMKLGSFHYAFESRIALLSAVIETAVPADITAVLDSIVPDDVDPASGDALDMESQLRRHFRGFYGLLQAEPGRMQAVIALGIYARNHP
ncbi:UNVERIFIED_CONTAM: TetR/AcrR family transcriptional regulator, partial [Bacteroidetes bacterium 56_B9]